MSLSAVNPHGNRIVSGMRPTGKLHLGHLHGVLKNWLKLQNEKECFFFAADWHALTTHYEQHVEIHRVVMDMVVDWLSVGLDPEKATIFVQSSVPEHSELALLLSMITPLGWLERVPTYKDQQEKLKELDLATHGFLGYPVLQSADILLYKAGYVPVGEDQVSHIEISREIARRFNSLYGKGVNFEQEIENLLNKLGKKNAKTLKKLIISYQEQGNKESLESGHELIGNASSISSDDKDMLNGYLEGRGKIILPEPQALLTDFPKVPGTDGQKMSKSYNNTIGITEEPKVVETKIRTMPTDPARVRRDDSGDPNKCPVWDLHKIYSNQEVKDWVIRGCTTANIGCIECKGSLADAIKKEQEPIRERAKEFGSDKGLVKKILVDGAQKARSVAEKTLTEVREKMGLS